MPQPSADQLQSIPMSPNLGQSLGRAKQFAREQSHRALLLEHLLLALTEDPEASGVLRACNVDIVRLATDVSGYLGRLTEDMRAAPGTEPAPDAELLRVIEAARQAAQQSRRRVIDGAIVLAAIVGDAKSPAAGLLKAHGMTFDEAIRTLQKASAQARSRQYAASVAPAPPPPEPPEQTPAREVEPERPPPAQERAATPSAAAKPAATGQSVDEILAAARARIQQRSAGAAPKPESKPPEPPPKVEPELPLMNLSSFAPASGPPPDMPDLPSPAARPPAASGLPPASPGASPAPPLPAGPPQAPPEPTLPPPRAFQRPSESTQRSPPPPRRPDRPPRGDWPDAAEPTLGRPAAANGALGGQRRPSAEAAPRPPPRPGAPPRYGQRPAAGPLMEAIPRRMRAGVETLAQVRIGRDKVDSLVQLLAGSRAPPQPGAVVAHVLSVRLKAPDGGFAIETETPETQWVEAASGQLHEDHIGWRWSVTPHRRGRHRLQLVVSARTIGRDGIGRETAPPDRIIEVAVRPQWLRRLLRLAALAIVLGLGVTLGRFSQDSLARDILDVMAALWRGVMGLLVTSGFLSG